VPKEYTLIKIKQSKLFSYRIGRVLIGDGIKAFLPESINNRIETNQTQIKG